MLHFGFNKQGGSMLGLLVIGIAFTIIGGVMAFVGFDQYRDGKETESWTATDGRVLSATIDEKTRTERRNGRTRTETTYTPVIRYEYTVEGFRYEGDDIRADDRSGNFSWANDLVDRYPVEAETTVYYDPDKPEDAVLIRGAESTQVYLFGGIGGLFGVIGLGALGFLGVLVRRLNRGYL
jgi:hypothetical protein